MDAFSKEKRSEIMRNIKGRNTMPEILVRKYLFNKGYRFSLHRKNLPGTPDIVLRKYKTAIFVNGCFWHGHESCRKGLSLPKTQTQYWKEKIESNKERDKRKTLQLKRLGWNVIVIHDCELKTKVLEQTMEAVIKHLIIGDCCNK